MRTSLLTLAFLLWCAFPIGAQSPIVTIPNPLPFGQSTWTDGILAGNELTVFLADNSSEPETRKLYRARLAGLEAPRSTGGGITEMLAGQSIVALANLTSAQPLYVQSVGIEKFSERESVELDFAKPSPLIASRKRIIVTVTIAARNQRKTPLQEDIGEQMLRVGLVWLRCEYKAELPPEIAAAYEAAQFDAKWNRRGIWRWLSAITYDDCLEHPERKTQPGRELPNRKP